MEVGVFWGKRPWGLVQELLDYLKLKMEITHSTETCLTIYRFIGCFTREDLKLCANFFFWFKAAMMQSANNITSSLQIPVFNTPIQL
jgi:hypothetical protein